eukprot:686598-Alexandrium_andersonii.AAC.1
MCRVHPARVHHGCEPPSAGAASIATSSLGSGHAERAPLALSAGCGPSEHAHRGRSRGSRVLALS